MKNKDLKKVEEAFGYKLGQNISTKELIFHSETLTDGTGYTYFPENGFGVFGDFNINRHFSLSPLKGLECKILPQLWSNLKALLHNYPALL